MISYSLMQRYSPPLAAVSWPVVLEERSVPGLHEALLSIFANRIDRASCVLDLGAGTGAWLSRLGAAGFHHLTGADHDETAFQVRGSAFVRVDLNRDFQSEFTGRFDAISAIEVIEHLENPRHFLRQCKQLLKPQGRLFVTTPNIECVPGRLRYLFTGQFRFFDRDPRYNDSTHISPSHSYQFSKAAADCGLSIETHTFNSETTTRTSWANRLACNVIKPLLQGVTGGDNHIYVLKLAP